MAASALDSRYMAAAIRYSRRHLGLTGENPSVGCLIVRDGIIVGHGVTAPGGRPHAEIVALAQAGEGARGATAYVTLEPCSHIGRSPPCAEALASAGIARAVVAALDPDPRVKGRGVRQLQDAAIAVEIGCLEAEARRAMAGFLSLKERGRPFLMLKLAVSSDGMIGRKGEGQVAVTGPLARAAVQAMRAEHDAILVGAGTAAEDDPLLTVRLAGHGRSPARIVIDPMGRTPPSARMIADTANGSVTFIASGRADARKLARLERAGATVKTLVSDHRGHIAPAEILRFIGMLGHKSVFLEGGAETARRFLQAGLVDRIGLFASPRALGANGVFAPLAPDRVPDGYRLVGERCYGDDRYFEYERA